MERNMASSEKLLPLGQAPQPGNAPAPKPRRTWLMGVLLTLVLIWSGRILMPWTFRVRSVNSTVPAFEAQCQQVEPLVPKRETPSLQKMDLLLLSPSYFNESVARLSGAVQVPTQSYDDLGPVGEDKRWEVFYDFAAYLHRTFPVVHGTLDIEKVNTHGLLYTWHGSDASLKPSILMAHQDVVPVAEATIGQWTYPPFSGTFDGHYVWGRGAMDCKSRVISVLEAVEQLINAGYQPKRTLVISFGFDEEIGGVQGAATLADALLERYGKDGAAVIVDEGGPIVPAYGVTLGLVGVAEKGYIDVEIVVRTAGGHSSVPPDHTGIGIMAELITRIEANPYEPFIDDENPFIDLMQCAAAYSPGFPPPLKKLLPKGKGHMCKKKKERLAREIARLDSQLKYLITTSVAVDVVDGGVKANALPERTHILINHRVNIGEGTADVRAKMTKLAGAVADKYNLTLHAFDGTTESPSAITLTERGTLEPAPVSPSSIDGVTPYAIVSGTTRALYGEKVIMTPGALGGNTDTKFYWDLTPHIFRFDPGYDPEENLKESGEHTVDEKTSAFNYLESIKWFTLFVRNMDEADLP